MMTKLIRTRQGALAYFGAPLLAFATLSLMLLSGVSSPFHAGMLAQHMPAFLILMAWMALALPAFAVLVRWVFLRLSGQRPLTGWRLVLMLPAALVMWIPAALLCLPMYLLNLIALFCGRYPAGQPIRWMPLLLIAAALVGFSAVSGWAEQYRRTSPAPTAAESFLRYSPDAQILAELPQGEDAVLIVANDCAGVFARDARGWTLRTPYRTTVADMGDAPAMGFICLNPEEGADVICITAVYGADRPTPRPRDTAGSAFILHTAPLGPNVLCTWYAIADAEAPGYAVTFE